MRRLVYLFVIAITLGVAVDAAAQVSIVQHTSVNSSGFTTSVSKSFTSNPVAGNTLVAVVGVNANNAGCLLTTSTITGYGVASWTLAANNQNYANVWLGGAFYGTAVNTTGPIQFTCTSTKTGKISMTIYELSSATFDTSNGLTTTNVAVPVSFGTGSITPVGPTEVLLYGYAAGFAGATVGAFGSPAGSFVSDNNNNIPNDSSYDQGHQVLASVSGSYSNTETISSSTAGGNLVGGVGIIVGFKGAAPTSTPTPTPTPTPGPTPVGGLSCGSFIPCLQYGRPYGPS